jgi:hypothetical protein
MALKMLFFFFKRKSALCIFAVWSTNHNGVNPSLKKVKKKGFFSYKHVVDIIKSVWPESPKRLCWKVVCCVYIQRDQGGKRLKKKRHCICTHTHTHTQAKGCNHWLYMFRSICTHMTKQVEGSTFPAWGSVTSILQYASWPNPCVLEGVCWVSLFACVSRTNIGWRVESKGRNWQWTHTHTQPFFLLLLLHPSLYLSTFQLDLFYRCVCILKKRKIIYRLCCHNNNWSSCCRKSSCNLFASQVTIMRNSSYSIKVEFSYLLIWWCCWRTDWLSGRQDSFVPGSCSHLSKSFLPHPFLNKKRTSKKKSHVQFSHFLPQDSPITTIFYRYFLASDSETVESSYRYVYTTVYSLT